MIDKWIISLSKFHKWMNTKSYQVSKTVDSVENKIGGPGLDLRTQWIPPNKKLSLLVSFPPCGSAPQQMLTNPKKA